MGPGSDYSVSLHISEIPKDHISFKNGGQDLHFLLLKGQKKLTKNANGKGTQTYNRQPHHINILSSTLKPVMSLVPTIGRLFHNFTASKASFEVSWPLHIINK